MRFAVVGLGIGEVHARVLAHMDQAELVGVCDIDPMLASRVAQDCGTQGFSGLESLLEYSKPEAVSLCTPPKTHLPLGKALAERGIHVLCEKPMAPTVADCLELTQACRDAKVTLMVAQKKRFAPAMQFLKEHVGRDFGAPVSLNYRFHPGQVPKGWFWAEDDGGGPILENAVHVFDTLRYLIGEVKSIQGLGGNYLNAKYAPQIDIGLGLLEFENGCIGGVQLGTASEWCIADEEFFLACKKAVARSRGGFDRPSELLYVYREDQQPQSYAVDYEGDSAHRDFIDEIGHFIECAKTGATPLVTGEDAAKSIACCLAMKQAVRTGKAVAPES